MIALAAVCVVFLFILMLLKNQPASFKQPQVITDDIVSPYLTHKVMTVLYEMLQKKGQSELVLTEAGLQDIISRESWPKPCGPFELHCPQIVLRKNRITLMARAKAVVETIVTVVIEPRNIESDRMVLHLDTVRLGSLPITAIAKSIARKELKKEFERQQIEPSDWQAKLAASLLDDQPIEPVFYMVLAEMRINRIDIQARQAALKIEVQ